MSKNSSWVELSWVVLCCVVLSWFLQTWMKLISNLCLEIIQLSWVELCRQTCIRLKSDLNALDFTVKRFLMKLLFKSVNMELVNECRIMFGVKLPSKSIAERTKKLICNLLASDNSLIKLLADSNWLYLFTCMCSSVPTCVFQLSNLVFLFFF
jgi:hypothetical protein